MIDIRVGDLWTYCNVDYYIVTSVGDHFVSIIDIKTEAFFDRYPKHQFDKVWQDQKEPQWTLLSRPAGLVEQ